MTLLTMTLSSAPRRANYDSAYHECTGHDILLHAKVCAALDGAVALTSGGGARSSLWSRVDTVVDEL